MEITQNVINWKIELKIKWTKHCVLSANENDNVKDNNDGNNIIFTTNDTQLYVPVITLKARENQKLSKLQSQGFERLDYWNGYKVKKWE